MHSPSAFATLTPDERQALYEHAKRHAAELRREAIDDFGAALAAGVRRLWRAAARAVAAPRHPRAA